MRTLKLESDNDIKKSLYLSMRFALARGPSSDCLCHLLSMFRRLMRIDHSTAYQVVEMAGQRTNGFGCVEHEVDVTNIDCRAL